MTRPPEDACRTLVQVVGIVQGVGFRPFVYRLATELGLGGWVCNDTSGVTICIEGPLVAAESFGGALVERAPPLARIDRCTHLSSTPVAQPARRFRIIETLHGNDRGALLTPDGHVCDDCLAELFDPANRRYRYPFINCTNCGPRFTIIESLPYDRPATTLTRFAGTPRATRPSAT